MLVLVSIPFVKFRYLTEHKNNIHLHLLVFLFCSWVCVFMRLTSFHWLCAQTISILMNNWTMRFNACIFITFNVETSFWSGSGIQLWPVTSLDFNGNPNQFFWRKFMIFFLCLDCIEKRMHTAEIWLIFSLSSYTVVYKNLNWFQFYWITRQIVIHFKKSK